MDEEYLGDGVYASFDGWHIVLDNRGWNIEPDNQEPSNRIVLEPEVYEALTKYVARLRQRRGV